MSIDQQGRGKCSYTYEHHEDRNGPAHEHKTPAET